MWPEEKAEGKDLLRAGTPRAAGLSPLGTPYSDLQAAAPHAPDSSAPVGTAVCEVTPGVRTMRQGTSNKWVLEISDGFSGSPCAYMSAPDDFHILFHYWVPRKWFSKGTFKDCEKKNVWRMRDHFRLRMWQKNSPREAGEVRKARREKQLELVCLRDSARSSQRRAVWWKTHMPLMIKSNFYLVSSVMLKIFT